MEKLYTSEAFLKMAGGRMYISHSTLLDLPMAVTTETIKRVWQRIGIFQSLGTINFVLFY